MSPASGAPSEQRIAHLTKYILHRERALDRDLLPFGDPREQDVLVFGAGPGNEVLWAARHGARSVVAIDIKPQSPLPIERALAELGISYDAYTLRCENIHDTALRGERYDLIVSNAAFEHVQDLKGVLGAFRALLKPAGRIAIYADSFWHSSIGGHIHKGPWEHLWRDPGELKAEIGPGLWETYCDHVNRMTVTDFLEAIRAAGLLVLQLQVNRDPNLAQLPDLLARIQQRVLVSPTDLSIVSVGCELCFVENL